MMEATSSPLLYVIPLD